LEKTIKAEIENIENIAKYYHFSMHQIDKIPGGYMAILTCRDGCDGSNAPAQEDVSNGIELAQHLIKKFPEFDIDLDTIDKWVNVNVQIQCTEAC
jgi:hypothetical protein